MLPTSGALPPPQHVTGIPRTPKLDPGSSEKFSRNGFIGILPSGNLTKNYGKWQFLTGKPWENHGKMVIYMENGKWPSRNSEFSH